MIIAIIAMAQRKRPRRKAARRSNKRKKGDVDSLVKILQGEIPLINEAYQSQCDPDPDIGDDETGQILIASLPFPDNNGDY